MRNPSLGLSGLTALFLSFVLVLGILAYDCPKKEVFPDYEVRAVYAERFSEISFLLPNGEKAELNFDPKKLDSSTLTILIDTPDGQHARTEFDLQSVR